MDSDPTQFNAPITPPISLIDEPHSIDIDIDIDTDPAHRVSIGSPYFPDDNPSFESSPQPESHPEHHPEPEPVPEQPQERPNDGGEQLLPPLRSLADETPHIVQRGQVLLTDFEVLETLGTGTFGRVLLVSLRELVPTTHRRVFAMKVLRKSEIVRQRQVEHVNAERYILSRVRHPFIADLYATFQDPLNIYMLLSFIPGGELFTHLRRARRFTPDVTRFYLATIILALKYLHSFNIIYRDLKPENLLLDSRGYLRLIDFGFAKIVEDRTWTLCGTPEYLAPEIIQNQGHGKAADWWACGILCYEMLVGYPPFFDDTAYGIYERVVAGRIMWPKDMDSLSREVIRGFLHPDRSKRLGNLIGGPEDVLAHPWFRGVDWDALERCEIGAPILPHVDASDDTRHFSNLPLPSAEDIPGLWPPDTPSSEFHGLDPYNHAFFEF